MGFYLRCRRQQPGAAAQADSGGPLMANEQGLAKAFAGRWRIVDMDLKLRLRTLLSSQPASGRSSTCDSTSSLSRAAIDGEDRQQAVDGVNLWRDFGRRPLSRVSRERTRLHHDARNRPLLGRRNFG
jgi:hypothetical protein